MLERHGRGKVDDGRPAARHRQEGGEAAVDSVQIVAGGGRETIERQVLARVVDFLGDKVANLRGKGRRCAFTVRLHCFDEECLATREAG